MATSYVCAEPESSSDSESSDSDRAGSGNLSRSTYDRIITNTILDLNDAEGSTNNVIIDHVFNIFDVLRCDDNITGLQRALLRGFSNGIYSENNGRFMINNSDPSAIAIWSKHIQEMKESSAGNCTVI